MNFYKKYFFITCIFTLSALTGCPHTQESTIKIETFDILNNLLTQSQGPIIIGLYKQNCPWCEKIKPILDHIASDQKFNNIGFYTTYGHNLKVPENTSSMSIAELIKKTTNKNIPGYPFLLFINQGQCIGTQIGAIPEDNLRTKIEKAFPSIMNQTTDQKSCNCGCNH